MWRRKKVIHMKAPASGWPQEPLTRMVLAVILLVIDWQVFSNRGQWDSLVDKSAWHIPGTDIKGWTWRHISAIPGRWRQRPENCPEPGGPASLEQQHGRNKRDPASARQKERTDSPKLFADLHICMHIHVCTHVHGTHTLIKTIYCIFIETGLCCHHVWSTHLGFEEINNISPVPPV